MVEFNRNEINNGSKIDQNHDQQYDFVVGPISAFEFRQLGTIQFGSPDRLG